MVIDFWGLPSSCCLAERDKHDPYADSSWRAECGPLEIKGPWMCLVFCEILSEITHSTSCIGVLEFFWRVFSYQRIFKCVHKPIKFNDSDLHAPTHSFLTLQNLPISKTKFHCSWTFPTILAHSAYSYFRTSLKKVTTVVSAPKESYLMC